MGIFYLCANFPIFIYLLEPIVRLSLRIILLTPQRVHEAVLEVLDA